MEKVLEAQIYSCEYFGRSMHVPVILTLPCIACDKTGTESPV